MLKPSVTWQGEWIWTADGRDVVNYHCYARRAFQLDAAPASATLHISAGTDYVLYVNAVFVGRGPTPSDPAYQSFDSHDVTALLRPGANVVAVLCHNYGVGTHWQYGGPGGLIAQLEVQTPAGPRVIASDGAWKMRRADCFAPNAPRFFWSCGFAESFDFHRWDPGWTQPAYDDRGWPAARPLPHEHGRRCQRLVPRVIPFLREAPEAAPVAAETGRFTLHGLHAVSFDGVVPPGQNHLAYAQTWFYTPQARDVLAVVESDDAVRFYLNGALVFDQTYNDVEVATKLWRGSDEYEQVHYGMHLGFGGAPQAAHLEAGWNRALVVVDQGPGGWGFTLRWLAAESGELLDLPFAAHPAGAADGADAAAWELAGPVFSSGLADSLDAPATDIAGVAAPIRTACDPFDYLRITDYSGLMGCEARRGWHAVAATVPLRLAAGEFAIYDLGVVKIGFPVLRLEAAGDAVLDVGLSQVAFDDRGIRFSNGGAMKNTDRLYLRPGSQTWEPLQRRTGRYIHLSCRSGEVTLAGVGFRLLTYPVTSVAEFACSDDRLNRIWEVSRYTSQLLMQAGYQDCLKREQGTSNLNQCTYQSLAAAYAFGDHDLARKTLLTAIRTQQDDGWFHSHGPSSPNQDEVTLCLYWMIWLRQYHLLSGDRSFVAEVFPAGEDMLRYFQKCTNARGLIDGSRLLVSRPGLMVYLDDSYNHGPNMGHFAGELPAFNLLWGHALAAAGDLAETLDRPDRAAFYRRKAARVRRAANARFWDPVRGLYRDWVLGDACAATHHPVLQIAAVHHGLADADQAASILRYLLDELGLPSADPDYPLFTFGYYYYFLDVLFEHGHAREALALLRSYYGGYLDAGATTFGEFLKLDWLRSGRLEREYEVHGYGTSAHAHFYTHILGVRPLAPGFTEIEVAPHPGDLAWARGRVATPQGIVSIAWQVEGETLRLDVQAPPGVGVTCTLRTPYILSNSFQNKANYAPI